MIFLLSKNMWFFCCPILNILNISTMTVQLVSVFECKLSWKTLQFLYHENKASKTSPMTAAFIYWQKTEVQIASIGIWLAKINMSEGCFEQQCDTDSASVKQRQQGRDAARCLQQCGEPPAGGGISRIWDELEAGCWSTLQLIHPNEWLTVFMTITSH